MNSKHSSKINTRQHLGILSVTLQPLTQIIFNHMKNNIHIFILHNHLIMSILFMDLPIHSFKRIKIMGVVIGILISIMQFIKIICLKEEEEECGEEKDIILRNFVQNIKNNKNVKINNHLLKIQGVMTKNK